MSKAAWLARHLEAGLSFDNLPLPCTFHGLIRSDGLFSAARTTIGGSIGLSSWRGEEE